MKVFIAGGNGLLGLESAYELIRRGHSVRSLSMRPLPENLSIPPEMETVTGNFVTLSDEELRFLLTGCEGFVFAGGVDERIELPAPVMDYYLKYNVTPVERMLRIGKDIGVKRAVIMGSYFSYFAKKWPEMKLAEKHPYIQSRKIQEEVAMSFNHSGMDIMMLELPYIFGTQPWRKPVWTFLVEIIKKMKIVTFYPRGGTTMVTVRQVAQAVAGALEKGKGGSCYPVGWFNLSW
ncbi:MAG TPA: NAD(P)-dependent oxidoreductase, partial [Paludibacter sp.]|nr:NAD(P)-dependent oxidoreductase [Paludibacter sp.]